MVGSATCHSYRSGGLRCEPCLIVRKGLAEKTIAVTGGARGIGLAIATALHGLGAKVAIGDIDESAAKEAGSRLGLEVCRGLDVTDRQSFTDFLDNVEGQLGPIDVLVNNAGLIAVGSAVDEADAISSGCLTSTSTA